MVPWTWFTPSETAASVFATAHSVSLWTWMPSGLEGLTTCLTSRIMSTISCGTQPPVVSQSTSQRAADHAEVFLERGAERRGDVEVPGLAEDGHDRRAGLDEGLQIRILLGAD